MVETSGTSDVQTIKYLQEVQDMSFEQNNFTIPNYHGLANSSVSTIRSCSRPIGSPSVHFAGINSCRPINNTTETQNPSYLEYIAKYKSHDMTHKVNYHE